MPRPPWPATAAAASIFVVHSFLRHRSCETFDRRNRPIPPFFHHRRAPYFRDGENSRQAERAATTGRDPAKHSKKDPAKPTRAKASRPELAPIEPALARSCSIPASARAPRGRARRPASAAGRTIRSTGAPISPPRTGRASRPRRASTRRRRRAMRRRCGAARRARSGLGAALWASTEDEHRCPPLPERDGADRARGEGSGLTTFRGITGASATVQALETLLREGRPEFSERPWTPHRPPRPEKSEGGQRAGDQVGLRAQGRPAAGDRRPGRGRQAPRPHPGAARRHRLGQDLHHGEGDRGRRSARRWCSRPTRRWRPSSTASSRSFFPDNAVEYFVSYYDYYQPEAYVPRTDTYIEKESSINEQIDRMRHSATRALLERDDVIIVASVSCIYGIGSVETYSAMTFTLKQRRAHRPAPADRRPGGAAIQAHRPATSTAARSGCAAT